MKTLTSIKMSITRGRVSKPVRNNAYLGGQNRNVISTALSLVIFILLASPICSQTLDSTQAKKLRLYIIECQGAKEQLQSALHEIELSDSALVKQFLTIENLKEMNANNEDFIGELRAEITRMKADKTAWWVYPAGGGLILVIGILTGLLIQ